MDIMGTNQKLCLFKRLESMDFFSMTFGTSVTKQDLKEQNNMFKKMCVGSLS